MVPTRFKPCILVKAGSKICQEAGQDIKLSPAPGEQAGGHNGSRGRSLRTRLAAPGVHSQSTMCTGQRPFSGSLASILGFSSPQPGGSPSETAPKPTRAACRRSGAPRLTWNRPGGGEALPRYITDSVGASGEALPPAAPVLGRVARRPSTPARPHSTSSTRRAGRGGKVSSRGAQGPRPGARPGARGTGSRIRAEVGEREREVPDRKSVV